MTDGTDYALELLGKLCAKLETELANHLESEAAETRRADELRAEVDDLKATLTERVLSELKTIERAHDAEAEIERLREQVKAYRDDVSKEVDANEVSIATVHQLRTERDALRKKCSRIRKSLRDLNKAHNVLWKVLSLHFEARRKEEA